MSTAKRKKIPTVKMQGNMHGVSIEQVGLNRWRLSGSGTVEIARAENLESMSVRWLVIEDDVQIGSWHSCQLALAHAVNWVGAHHEASPKV